MKVRDLMNAEPVTCQKADTISEAARMMKERKISGMPVMDEERLVGVISESDILQLLSPKSEGQLWLPSPFEIFEVPFRDLLKLQQMQGDIEDISKKKVSEIMHRDVRKIGPDDSAEEAALLMTRHRINRLPVVENGKLVGIITRGDIIIGLGRSHEVS
jgi:CBS domain-containing protein